MRQFPKSFHDEFDRHADTVGEVASILDFVGFAVAARTTEFDLPTGCVDGFGALMQVLSDTLKHVDHCEIAASDQSADRVASAREEGRRAGFTEGKETVRAEIDALRARVPAEPAPVSSGEVFPKIKAPAKRAPGPKAWHASITRAGVIAIDGRSFTAPELNGRFGQPVRVEFTSDAHDQVRVFDERGDLICVAPPDTGDAVAPRQAEAC